jgi:hypothetical protein
MRLLFLMLSLELSLPALGFSQVGNKPPETFSASAQVRDGAVVTAATFRMHIDRYATDDERNAAVEALNTGGSSAVVPWLQKVPAVGYIEATDKKWTIRFARQEKTPNGRRIVAVVDQPIYFVGGGMVDAKPREGFDVAVIQLDVDEIGMGHGIMAGAARLQPGGPAGVEVADYADEPIKIVMVTKIIS